MKYGTTVLKVPAVGYVQTDEVAAAPAPTTFGEPMVSVNIVARKSQM